MDEAYFRKAYDADPANAARQPWPKYIDWVKRFYDGSRFPPVKGWTAQIDAIGKRLDADARASLTPRVEELGRIIASEWAKDNAVRRVSTGDLQGWGRDMEKAVKADPGDGTILAPALDAIEKQASGRAPPAR